MAIEPIELLRICYPARREIIPCLLGEPGIGKTQCVYQLGEELGVDVHMMNMNGKTPNEIVGMAMPNSELGTMEMFDYGILCKAKDGDIIIIDEMLTAAPSCLNAILTLAESRILPSGKRIADAMIVAAANPLASPERISLAIRDRFQFIEVKFNMFNWKEYIHRKYGIWLENDLLNKVKVHGKEYNVPTPRTVTKYIWWLTQVCKTKEERLGVYEVIEQVFDKGMSDAFKLQFENDKRSNKQKVIDSLKECGLSFNEDPFTKRTFLIRETEDAHLAATGISIAKPLDEIDESNMLDMVMSLDNWSEIEQLLSEMRLDEEGVL